MFITQRNTVLLQKLYWTFFFRFYSLKISIVRFSIAKLDRQLSWLKK